MIQLQIISCSCLGCALRGLYNNVVLQTGESLVEGGHYASDDIESRVEELFAKWEELLEATDRKRIGLEQALSLVLFKRKVCYVIVVCRVNVLCKL